jgi:hypothetical protein
VISARRSWLGLLPFPKPDNRAEREIGEGSNPNRPVAADESPAGWAGCDGLADAPAATLDYTAWTMESTT